MCFYYLYSILIMEREPVNRDQRIIWMSHPWPPMVSTSAVLQLWLDRLRKEETLLLLWDGANNTGAVQNCIYTLHGVSYIITTKGIKWIESKEKPATFQENPNIKTEQKLSKSSVNALLCSVESSQAPIQTRRNWNWVCPFSWKILNLEKHIKNSYISLILL